MPMAEHSILVGKTYRTPEGERREVSSIDDGRVTYRALSAPHASAVLARVPQRHASLPEFAADVESECAPPSG